MPKGKNEKNTTKFVGLRPKTYSYLVDGGNEDKKAKATKKLIIKRKLKVKLQKLFRSYSTRG